MEKYNPNAKCQKCGCQGIKDEFKGGMTQEEAEKNTEYYKRILGAFAATCEPFPEYIHRTCFNCGFAWDESPLDVEERRIKQSMAAHDAENTDEMSDRICEMARADEPVIDVGDIVKMGDSPVDCEVVELYPKSSGRMSVKKLETFYVRKSDATIIRKGRKTHTFRGVSWSKAGVSGGIPTPYVPSIEDIIALEALMGDGKHYTLTLTEEEEK